MSLRGNHTTENHYLFNDLLWLRSYIGSRSSSIMKNLEYDLSVTINKLYQIMFSINIKIRQ